MQCKGALTDASAYHLNGYNEKGEIDQLSTSPYDRASEGNAEFTFVDEHLTL